MQTIALSPLPKKSAYAVKLWEITPLRDGQKSLSKKDKASFGFIF